MADAKIEFYSNEENKTGYVLENEYLKLEMDGATGYFTLTDKIGGAKWDSVPAGAEDDPRADTDSRNKMRSTLIISYTDRTGNVFTYDNYTYGISGGSFRITEEDETLILDYMLGPEKRNFVVPEALTETKMQEWLDKMEQGDKTIVLRTYRKLDLSKIKDPERQKELLEYLPQLETDVMYALSQATGGQPVKNYQMEQLETIFTNLGYTKEQAEEDKVNKEETEDSIQVNISMHFRLDGDCLVVDVPQDKLVYNAEYPVTQIRPLPYLCAAGDEDDGYMLIPDGGGGQIFFHNGKTKANAYFADVYGFNEVFDRKMRIQETSASFPVFGIAKNGNYLLAIGESGAAEMSVEADIAGKNSSFDHVCPVFTAVHALPAESITTFVFSGIKFEDVASAANPDNTMGSSVNTDFDYSIFYAKSEDPDKEPTQDPTEATKPTEPSADATEATKPTEPSADATEGTQPGNDATQATQSGEQSTKPNAPTQPGQTTEPSQPNGIWIVIVASVVIAGVGAAAFVLIRRKKAAAEAEPAAEVEAEETPAEAEDTQTEETDE